MLRSAVLGDYLSMRMRGKRLVLQIGLSMHVTARTTVLEQCTVVFTVNAGRRGSEQEEYKQARCSYSARAAARRQVW